MTDHQWSRIETPYVEEVCVACRQCKCFETPSQQCPGAWIPDQQSSFQQIDPNTYRVAGLKRSAITMRYVGEEKE